MERMGKEKRREGEIKKKEKRGKDCDRHPFDPDC